MLFKDTADRCFTDVLNEVKKSDDNKYFDDLCCYVTATYKAIHAARKEGGIEALRSALEETAEAREFIRWKKLGIEALYLRTIFNVDTNVAKDLGAILEIHSHCSDPSLSRLKSRIGYRGWSVKRQASWARRWLREVGSAVTACAPKREMAQVLPPTD